jgi:hypothetical protein
VSPFLQDHYRIIQTSHDKEKHPGVTVVKDGLFYRKLCSPDIDHPLKFMEELNSIRWYVHKNNNDIRKLPQIKEPFLNTCVLLVYSKTKSK